MARSYLWVTNMTGRWPPPAAMSRFSSCPTVPCSGMDSACQHSACQPWKVPLRASQGLLAAPYSTCSNRQCWDCKAAVWQVHMLLPCRHAPVVIRSMHLHGIKTVYHVTTRQADCSTNIYSYVNSAAAVNKRSWDYTHALVCSTYLPA